MVSGTFDISDYSLASGRVGGRRNSARASECLRYRLDVFAASTVDVVQSAGGWLYDRAMAGWEVAVLLPPGCDGRPLRILGVRVADRDPGFETGFLEGAPPQSLAVSADAFAGDPDLREEVRKALDDRLTEVALWGDGWPLDVNRAMTRAHHTLSAAARAYKGHALAAAGIRCDSIDSVETLLAREP